MQGATARVHGPGHAVPGTALYGTSYGKRGRSTPAPGSEAAAHKHTSMRYTPACTVALCLLQITAGHLSKSAYASLTHEHLPMPCCGGDRRSSRSTCTARAASIWATRCVRRRGSWAARR